MRQAGVCATLFAAVVLASPAEAQLGGTDLVPWPQTLPPADVPNEAQAHPVKHCRKGGVRCVARLERRLRRQYRRYAASCDHRAVISYSYLQITRGLRQDMKRPLGLVRQRRWMGYLITAFSNRYFEAFRNWNRGLPVAESWRTTFEAAADGDYQAGQEVLLFSNAHVQHDLPFAYEEMGIETRSGRSRKPDHDAVNEINARVFDGIEKHVAAHFDPSFSLIDIPFAPLEEIGALELVKLWRENAWRSAERLVAAGSEAERAEVVAQIDRSSTAWAQAISSGSFPGYGDSRDEYCHSHPPATRPST